MSIDPIHPPQPFSGTPPMATTLGEIVDYVAEEAQKKIAAWVVTPQQEKTERPPVAQHDGHFDCEWDQPIHSASTSQTILSQAQEIIAGRHERYGDCTEVFAATNEMFAIYRGLKKGETSAHDTAVFNIIQKLVRIGSGQNHQDNWIDIAGYAATGGEVSE